MKRFRILLTILVLSGLVLASCAAPAEEPMVVEEPEVVEEVVEEPMVEEEEVIIEFWTTDNEPARLDVYEAIADKYMEEHPNIDLRIVAIEEAGISQRIATALAANRLPDIVRMGVERVATLAADEILDEDAAVAVIDSIGKDDFREAPLEMVTNPTTGKYAAIPYDGWVQAIWYRSDVFTTAELDAPVTWEAINAACDALPGTGNLLYALTLGTDPGQNYGHQVFEQVAMSNDALSLIHI